MQIIFKKIPEIKNNCKQLAKNNYIWPIKNNLKQVY